MDLGYIVLVGAEIVLIQDVRGSSFWVVEGCRRHCPKPSEGLHDGMPLLRSELRRRLQTFPKPPKPRGSLGPMLVFKSCRAHGMFRFQLHPPPFLSRP